jgi:hypothetical protein
LRLAGIAQLQSNISCLERLAYFKLKIFFFALNKAKLSLLLLAGLAFTLTGCDAAVGIFEAGFWGGMVLEVLVVLLVFT